MDFVIETEMQYYLIGLKTNAGYKTFKPCSFVLYFELQSKYFADLSRAPDLSFRIYEKICIAYKSQLLKLKIHKTALWKLKKTFENL